MTEKTRQNRSWELSQKLRELVRYHYPKLNNKYHIDYVIERILRDYRNTKEAVSVFDYSIKEAYHGAESSIDFEDEAIFLCNLFQRLFFDYENDEKCEYIGLGLISSSKIDYENKIIKLESCNLNNILELITVRQIRKLKMKPIKGTNLLIDTSKNLIEKLIFGPLCPYNFDIPMERE